MDPNTNNQAQNQTKTLTPNMPLNPTTPNQNSNNGDGKKVGPVIAILIIVLVLIIAALYLFASRIDSNKSVNNENASNSADYQGMMASTSAQTSVKPVTNTSDDPNTIQADLEQSDSGLNDNNF